MVQFRICKFTIPHQTKCPQPPHRVQWVEQGWGHTGGGDRCGCALEAWGRVGVCAFAVEQQLVLVEGGWQQPPPSHVAPNRRGPRGRLMSRKHKREDSLPDGNHAALTLLKLQFLK